MSAQQNPKNLEQDELVQFLAPDPEQRIPESYTISGWLGKSTHKGYWRLYPTPELDEYVEIADADILLRREVDKTQSPLGGTVLMIKGSAELHSAGSARVDARTAFLQGDITADFSTRSVSELASQIGGGGLGNKDYTKGFWCNVSMFFACTTHVVRNPVCTTASGKLCGTARFLP
jgi:hypothetical protein